ncbi:MAG: hypothetical protein HRF43_16340 [Phycisphaerae bacterium]|jgi:hypothetical protein
MFHVSRYRRTVIGLGFIGSFGAIGEARAQSEESFRPVVWGPGQVASDYVQYSARFFSNGQESSHFFLNVVRADGSWVVQNLPVGYESGLSRIATNVPASLFQSGALYHTSFSVTYATAAPAFDAAAAVAHTLGTPVNYLVNGGACRSDYGVFTAPGAAPLSLLGFEPPGGLRFRVSYHDGVPDLAQGPNECGPTSVANSITWLEQENPAVDTGMTTAEIRDVLKDGDHMQTSPVTGTSDANFLDGKQQFVDELRLPIDTQTIGGGPGNLPGADAILETLGEGADVELSVVWKGGGGHWVTVVGMIDFGEQYGVWINDPDDGVEQVQFHFLDVRPDGTLSLRGYGDNTVDLTVSEKVRPPPSPLAVLCGNLGLGLFVFISLSLMGLGRRYRYAPGTT